MSATALATRPTPPQNAGVVGIDRLVVFSDDPRTTGGAGGVARKNVVRAVEQGLKVTALLGDGASAAGLPPGVEVVHLFGGALTAVGGLSAGLGGVFNPGVRKRAARWIAERDTPGTTSRRYNDAGRLAELNVNGFRLRDRLAPNAETWGRSLAQIDRSGIVEALSKTRGAPCE